MANIDGFIVKGQQYGIEGGGGSSHLYMLTFVLYSCYFHMFTKTPSGLNGKNLNDENDLTTIALTSTEQEALLNSLTNLIGTLDDFSDETGIHYAKSSFGIASGYFKNHSSVCVNLDEEEGNTDTTVYIEFFDDGGQDVTDCNFTFNMDYSD